MPFDTAKVRLQIQGEGKGTIKYKGMFHTIYLMTKKEGFRSLYNGLDAGIHRQLFFTSFRLVFYDIVHCSLYIYLVPDAICLDILCTEFCERY